MCKIRFHAIVALWVAFCVTSTPLAADSLQWDDEGNSKRWGVVDNWLPNEDPSGHDLEIGVHPDAQNDVTLLDRNFTVNSLSILNGAAV